MNARRQLIIVSSVVILMALLASFFFRRENDAPEKVPEGREWQLSYTSSNAFSAGGLVAVRARVRHNDTVLDMHTTRPVLHGYCRLIDTTRGTDDETVSGEIGWGYDEKSCEYIIQGLPYYMFESTNSRYRAKFTVINQLTGREFEKIFDVDSKENTK